MRPRLLILLACVAAAFTPASVALADSGPSAGDQQYVDPLSGSSSHHTSTTHTTTAPASAPAPVASTPTSTASAATATATATASASTTTGATGRTLPFTGYDTPLAVALGAGLAGGGLLLRRRLASSSR